MALDKEDARRVVNALSAETSRMEQELKVGSQNDVSTAQSCYEKADIRFPEAASQYYRRGPLLEARAQFRTFAVGAVGYVGSLIEGIKWLACGEKNRGLGCIEGVPGNIEFFIECVQIYEKAIKAEKAFSITNLSEPGQELAKAVDEAKEGRTASLLNAGIKVAEKLGGWEQFRAETKGCANLLDIFKRIKYDVEESLSQETVLRKCLACGESNPSGAKFCNKCGRQL